MQGLATTTPQSPDITASLERTKMCLPHPTHKNSHKHLSIIPPRESPLLCLLSLTPHLHLTSAPSNQHLIRASSSSAAPFPDVAPKPLAAGPTSIATTMELMPSRRRCFGVRWSSVVAVRVEGIGGFRGRIR
jgi:hypothetical protein